MRKISLWNELNPYLISFLTFWLVDLYAQWYANKIEVKAQMHSEYVLFQGYEYAASASFVVGILVVLFNKKRTKLNKVIHSILLLPTSFALNIVVMELLEFGLIGPAIEFIKKLFVR